MARGTRDEISPREIAKRIQRREFNGKNPRAAGTKPAPRRFPVKCSNLARGESTKDPVDIFGCGRGFSYGANASGCTRSRAMRSGGSDHRISQELTRPLWSYQRGKVCHARMDGDSDQCDRLCRLRRYRDVSPIARSPIRKRISGPLSAEPPRRASVRLAQFARGADQPVGLDQGMAAFSLRPQ